MNNLSNRKFVIILIFLFIGIVYILRLFYIQVLDDKWTLESASIVQKQVTIKPSRGLVFDRNGNSLVENKSVYNLMVIPGAVKDLDTLKFCSVLNISKDEFNHKMNKAWGADERWRVTTIRSKQYNKNKNYLDTLSGFYFGTSRRKINSIDVTVVASKTTIFDTLRVANIFEVSKKFLIKELARSHKMPIRRYTSQIFEKQIPSDQFEKINDNLYLFPGFFKKTETIRYYPDSVAAHIVGYVREIDQKKLDEDKYYHLGDYVGITGLESFYEIDLRGKRGKYYYLQDVFQNKKTTLNDGEKDIYAQEGERLYTSIDISLQKYGEKLMQNKTGAIVAIDPSTGEILAMISAPTYDPNLLVGRGFRKNYADLVLNDSLRPLNNRALRADYRPGSIFKLVQSLIGLQEEVITPYTGFTCNKYPIGCHDHEYPSNIKKAIKHSCNPYFYNVYKRIILQDRTKSIFIDSRSGLTKWHNYVSHFGFGTKLDTDIPGVRIGRVPDTTFYDKVYGMNRWAFSNFRSNSIGEGELAVSPLQIANLGAIIANKGFFYEPHFVTKKEINGEWENIFFQKQNVGIDSSYFPFIVEGMKEVVLSGGTARRAAIPKIEVAGKTGTIQNGSFRDHSAFVAFAPADNPKIAISVYVEYAGFGGTYAAPIASLMMEKYLTDTITNKYKENRILDAVIEKGKPIRSLKTGNSLE